VRAAADHTQLQHWACGRDRGTTWQLECLDADGEDGGDHDDEDDEQ
jgi:hypothetical protein